MNAILTPAIRRALFGQAAVPGSRAVEPGVPMRLGRDELASLRIEAGGRLEVLRGLAWLTIDGEPADHFLGRCESLALAPGSVIRVSGEAAGSTLLRFVVSSPAPGGVASRLARAARRLVHHLIGRTSWQG